jgi:hypothetical protein
MTTSAHRIALGIFAPTGRNHRAVDAELFTALGLVADPVRLR